MLARLQQHWKVKRLRGISAGPGGNAGFTIDLTYPQMPIEMLGGLSMKSAGLYSVNVEQDSSGLLIADIPSHSINTIRIHFVGPYIPHSHLSSRDKLASLSPDSAVCEGTRTGMERKQFISNGKDVGEAVSKGATTAHSVLRRIQMALVEEQVERRVNIYNVL
jgi:mediator of RNA polymerase II transcription subunit 17